MKINLFRLISLCALLLTVRSPARALPDLGYSSYASLPPSEEQRLGGLFMQQVKHSVPLLKDPVLTHYVNTLGRKLASHSNAKERHFDFFLVDSGDINAFAGPSGHVGINAGTILLAQSEDELAGVLSHEITHVSQHHLARAMENARGSTLTALATVAAALVAGSMGHGDAAVPGLMVAQSLNIEKQLGYTRENEREADRIGIQVLHSSNYDPQAMPQFLARMSKQQIDLYDGRFSYLRTHPINEERIADAKSRADHYPAHPPKPSLTFELMKSRLLVLSGQYSPTKLNSSGYYKPKKNNANSLPHRYAQALLLHRGRKLQEAEKQMSALHQEHPEISLFTLGLAEIYTDQHQLKNAENLLEQAHALNPDYPPLLLSYSSILMQAHKNKKALALLDHYYKEKQDDNADILERLAMAQAKNGQLSRAYLTRARLYRLNEEHEQAQLQTHQALKYATAKEKFYIRNEARKIRETLILEEKKPQMNAGASTYARSSPLTKAHRLSSSEKH